MSDYDNYLTRDDPFGEKWGQEYDDEPQPCGEGMCRCRCFPQEHPCGCDCPHPDDCQCDTCDTGGAA